MRHPLTIIAALIAVAADWPTTGWPTFTVPTETATTWPAFKVPQVDTPPPLPEPEVPKRSGHWERRGRFGRQRVWVEDTAEEQRDTGASVAPITGFAPSQGDGACRT